MAKKILMLGGSYFQVPAIQYAKKAGHYVITADYLPDNPGHQFADEYYNVSTTDKEAVLKLAKKLKINGIISYASDPGAPIAAYVSEKMGIPGNPYDAVITLQRKDLFRQFLKEHNFNMPQAHSFENVEDANNCAKDMLRDGALIVKPVDSSGSKGVSKIAHIKDFEVGFNHAMQYSAVKKVMVEEYIVKHSYQMDGDGFVWNKKLVFRCFGNQHNDHECHSYVPSGISFPYIQNDTVQMKAHEIIENILCKLNMKIGGLNIEYITDHNDNVYILEIGPRNGGNLIPEVIKYATGVDLIAYAVEGALGKDCSDLECGASQGYWASYIVHSKHNGSFHDVGIQPDIVENIVEKNIWKNPGDRVKKFNGSNDTVGTMILKFKSEDEMLCKMDNMNDFINVNVLKEDKV